MQQLYVTIREFNIESSPSIFCKQERGRDTRSKHSKIQQTSSLKILFKDLKTQISFECALYNTGRFTVNTEGFT